GAATSTNATLSLVGAPNIYSQPKDQSVSLGATVTFSVGVSGTPPVMYQWRLNGADIPGAINRTITVANVTLANSGQRYRVFVKNALGSATSQEALLIVDPTFTKITTGSIVNDGGQSSAAAWADYNNDGYLDLVVANGGGGADENEFLYRNNGDGTFTKLT